MILMFKWLYEYKYYFLTTVYNESGVSSRRKITDMSVYFALHVCANSCYEVTKIIALIGELEQTCLRIEILWSRNWIINNRTTNMLL